MADFLFQLHIKLLNNPISAAGVLSFCNGGYLINLLLHLLRVTIFLIKLTQHKFDISHKNIHNQFILTVSLCK